MEARRLGLLGVAVLVGVNFGSAFVGPFAAQDDVAAVDLEVVVSLLADADHVFAAGKVNDDGLVGGVRGGSGGSDALVVHEVVVGDGSVVRDVEGESRAGVGDGLLGELVAGVGVVRQQGRFAGVVAACVFDPGRSLGLGGGDRDGKGE